MPSVPSALSRLTLLAGLLIASSIPLTARAPDLNLPGKYGFLDTEGNPVIPCQWDYAEGFANGLALVYRNQKAGFIDRSGTLVIPCTWDWAGLFWDENLVPVRKDKKWGAIDRTGKLIIPCDWDSIGELSDTLVIVEKDKLFGLIDKQNQVIQAPQWTNLRSYGTCYASETEGKWGILDLQGNVICPPKWDRISGYPGGIFQGELILEESSKFTLYDPTGKIIAGNLDEIHYATAETPSFSPHSPSPPSLLKIRKGQKWGYLTVKGRVISEPQWDHPANFSDGFAVVSKNNDDTILAESGEARGFPEYQISPINNGLFRVIEKKSQKVGYLAKDGKLQVPCEWDFDSKNAWTDRVIVSRAGKFGIIDLTGQIICPPVWDDIDDLNHKDRLLVSRDGLTGLANLKGELLGDLKWQKIHDFEDGLAPALTDNSFSLIDQNGVIVITHPWTFESYEYDGYLVRSGKKLGFVNTLGKVIAQPEWDRVESDGPGDDLLVQRDQKWGLIEPSTGRVITEPIWDEIHGFERVDGKTAGPCFVRRGKKWATMNRQGILLSELQWDQFRWCISQPGFCDSDPERTARTNTNFGYVVQQGDLFGYVDENGITTLPPRFQNLSFIGDLSHTFENDRFGIYHKSESEITPVQWQSYSDYEEGMAAVQMPDDAQER
jgi:hypothetical protein